MGAVVLSLQIIRETIAGPVFTPWLARHPLGPEARSEQIGAWVDGAAASAGVKRDRLLGLLQHESNLNPKARSKVGAVGFAQLFWRPYVRSWRADCRLDPSRCEESSIHHGAWALRYSLLKCGGSYARAFGHYRSGKCQTRGKEFATVRLSNMIAERLRKPSTRRLVAPRLR